MVLLSNTMRVKVKRYNMVLCLTLVAVLLISLFFTLVPVGKREGIENMSNFTGLAFFTKTKDCDACDSLKPTVVLLYEKFPNNIRVIDCTDETLVSTTLTQYSVNIKNLPTILAFKSGVPKPYSGYTEYKELEDFLLKLMSSQKPTTTTDATIASMKDS